MIAAAMGALRAVCTFLERCTYINPQKDSVFKNLRQDLWGTQQGRAEYQRRQVRQERARADSDSTDVSVGYVSSDENNLNSADENEDEGQ
jgi:hypothetical protein